MEKQKKLSIFNDRYKNQIYIDSDYRKYFKGTKYKLFIYRVPLKRSEFHKGYWSKNSDSPVIYTSKLRLKFFLFTPDLEFGKVWFNFAYDKRKLLKNIRKLVGVKNSKRLNIKIIKDYDYFFKLLETLNLESNTKDLKENNQKGN
jgi:hypothetical protein